MKMNYKNNLRTMALLLSMLGIGSAMMCVRPYDGEDVTEVTDEMTKLGMFENGSRTNLRAKRYYHGVSLPPVWGLDEQPVYHKIRTFTVRLRKNRKASRWASSYETRELKAHIDRGVLQFFSYACGKCKKCKGTGELNDLWCPKCKGSGKSKYTKFQIKGINKVEVEKKPPKDLREASQRKQKVLLTLAPTHRQLRIKMNKYLSINNAQNDDSIDFLRFCLEYQVPLDGFDKNQIVTLQREDIKIKGDYAHPFSNNRGILRRGGESFRISCFGKKGFGHSTISVQGKLTIAGNLAHFILGETQYNTIFHIKCIKKPALNGKIQLITKSTTKDGTVLNRSMFCNSTNIDGLKFLDFCRRYNVKSEEDWLQDPQNDTQMIPICEDKLFTTDLQGHAVGTGLTGDYIFTIKHANAPARRYTDTEKYNAAYSAYQENLEKETMLRQLPHHLNHLNMGMNSAMRSVRDLQIKELETKLTYAELKGEGKTRFGRIDVYKTIKNSYSAFKARAGGIVAATGGICYLFTGMKTGSQFREFTTAITNNNKEAPKFETSIATMIKKLSQVTLISLDVTENAKKTKHIWVGKGIAESYLKVVLNAKDYNKLFNKMDYIIHNRTDDLSEFRMQIQNWFRNSCEVNTNLNDVMVEIIRCTMDHENKPIKMTWTPGMMQSLTESEGRECVLMFDMGGGSFKVTTRDGNQIMTGNYDFEASGGLGVKEVNVFNEETGKVDAKKPGIQDMTAVLEFVKAYITKLNGDKGGPRTGTKIGMENVAVGFTGRWRQVDAPEEFKKAKPAYKQFFKKNGIKEEWIADVSNIDEAKYMGRLMNNLIDGHASCKGKTFTNKVLCEVSSTTGQWYQPITIKARQFEDDDQKVDEEPPQPATHPETRARDGRKNRGPPAAPRISSSPADPVKKAKEPAASSPTPAPMMMGGAAQQAKPVQEDSPEPEPEQEEAPAEEELKDWRCTRCKCTKHEKDQPSCSNGHGLMEQVSGRRRLESRPIHKLWKEIRQMQAQF